MPLERRNLDEFTRGWFVGDFTPTLFANPAMEVALQRYQSGDYERRHVHKVATELTLIVSGLARMNGEEVRPGEIIVIKPGESTDFEALAETSAMVVKFPCAKGDKYLCEDDGTPTPSIK